MYLELLTHSMIFLGLATMGSMFAFVIACERV